MRYPVGTILVFNSAYKVVTGIVIGYDKKLFVVKWADSGEIMKYSAFDIAPFVVE